jgi:molybdopterin-guanine dinucleotide biosynthesis protein A
MGYNKMDALILAGGENKRLPLIKGFLEINGKKIIESNTELLKRIFDRVIISTNNPELYFYLGVLMVGDIMKYRGPMTGIFSVLAIPEVSEIFVTPCDMPFLNAELVKYIVHRWSEERDAVIPVFDKRPQPLLGIYSKRIIRKLEEAIKHGKRSLREFLQEVDVLYIEEEIVRSMDREGRSFININTMDDYLLIAHRS